MTPLATPTINASSLPINYLFNTAFAIVAGIESGRFVLNQANAELISSLSDDIAVIDQNEADECAPRGRYEISLVKAAKQFLLRFQNQQMAGVIVPGQNLIGLDLGIPKLSKAVADLQVAEAEVDLLRTTLYVWADREATADDARIFRTRLFVNGRPFDGQGGGEDYVVLPRYETAGDAAATQGPGLIQKFPDLQVIFEAAPKPMQFCLMRTDLASLNPGKAVAQGMHAANKMVYDARIKDDEQLSEMIGEWEREADGFGTAIVLGATDAQVRASLLSAKAAGVHAAITHDPTYPLLDGQTLFLIPVDTCGYIFDYKVHIRPHVAGLALHP